MLVARVIARLELGGTQLGALRLTQALARRGTQTLVLAGEASAECARLYTEAGIRLEVWGGASDLQYACSPSFAKWLRPRLGGADLVHAHMFGGWWAAAEAAPEAALAASEHNALQWPAGPPLEEMRHALRRVDAFFTHGPATRVTLRELGFPAARIHAGRSPIELPSRWGSTPGPGAADGVGHPLVLFAGRLHEEKGPDLLLEALGLLGRPVFCCLLGTGPEEDRLRRRIAELGLAGTVAMPGWERTVARWMERADLVVVPSRYESWSQTAVTAMAHGVPVVGTNVEGLPMTLAEGRGILVPAEDPAMLAAAVDDVLLGRRRPDGAAARRYAMRFTPDRVAAHYAGIYAGMLTMRRPTTETEWTVQASERSELSRRAAA
jgi:glycosyltransferase involved in cell wall biosynthesis